MPRNAGIGNEEDRKLYGIELFEDLVSQYSSTSNNSKKLSVKELVECLKKCSVALLKCNIESFDDNFSQLAYKFAKRFTNSVGTTKGANGIRENTEPFNIMSETAQCLYCILTVKLVLARAAENVSSLFLQEGDDNTNPDCREISKDNIFYVLTFLKWFLNQMFCENKFLHNQDLLKELLKCFKLVLQDELEEFWEIKKIILKLISLYFKWSASISDMEEFFSFFKENGTFNKSMLDVYCQAFRNLFPTPRSFVRFPISLLQSKPICSTFQKNNFNYYVQNSSRNLQGHQENETDAWNSQGEVYASFNYESKWCPEDSSCAISLWIQVEGWEKNSKLYKGKKSVNSHLLSFGNKSFMMEIFINLHKKLCLRVIINGCVTTIRHSVFNKLFFVRSRWHCLTLDFCHSFDLMKKTFKTKCRASVDLIEDVVDVEGKLFDVGRIENQSQFFLSFGHTWSGNQFTCTKYKLGNIHIFKEGFPSKNSILWYSSLFRCLGPNFILHDYPHFLPTSVLHRCILANVGVKFLFEDFEAMLDNLKCSIFCIYSTSHHNILMLIKTSKNVKNTMKTIDLKFKSEDVAADDEHHTSFYNSFCYSGGMQSLMFLCARVFESNSDEDDQCKALSTVFFVSHYDFINAEEFNRIDGNSMIIRLLSTSKCIASYKLLKVLLEFSTNGCLTVQEVSPRFTDTPARHHIIQSTSKFLLMDVKLVIDFVLCRHIWKSSEDGLWFLIFQALKLLTSVESETASADKLQSSGLFETIIKIFIERFDDDSTLTYMSEGTCRMCYYVLLNFINSTSDRIHLHAYIKAAIKALLFFHPTAQTFIAHKKSSFFWTKKWEVSDTSSSSLRTSSAVSFSEESSEKGDKESSIYSSSRRSSYRDITTIFDEPEIICKRSSDDIFWSEKTKECSYFCTALLELIGEICRKIGLEGKEEILRDATIVQVLLTLITSEQKNIQLSTLELLQILLNDASDEVLKTWSDYGYFHMLANQLHRIRIDEILLNEICAIVFNVSQSCSYISFPTVQNLPCLKNILCPLSILLLMGSLHSLDNQLSNFVISILEQAYYCRTYITSSLPESMLKNGIIQVLSNKLFVLRADAQHYSSFVNRIFQLVCFVASYSFFSSSKSIHNEFDTIRLTIQTFQESYVDFCHLDRSTLERRLIETISFHLEKNFVIYSLQKDNLSQDSSCSSSDENLKVLFTSSASPSSIESSSDDHTDIDAPLAMSVFIRSNPVNEKELAARLEKLLKTSVEYSIYKENSSIDFKEFLLRSIFHFNWMFKSSRTKSFIHKSLSKIQKAILLMAVNLLNSILFEVKMDSDQIDSLLSELTSNAQFFNNSSKNTSIYWLKLNMLKFVMENYSELSFEQKSYAKKFLKGLQNSDDYLDLEELLQHDKHQIKLELLKTLLDTSQYRNNFLNQQSDLRKVTKEMQYSSNSSISSLSRKVSQVSKRNTDDLVGFQMNLNQEFQTTKLQANRDEMIITKRWKRLIQSLTHERAIWHFKDLYPKSWMLDTTEGPMGVRTRMKRCHLNLSKEFFLSHYFYKSTNQQLIIQPLSFLFNDEHLNKESQHSVFKMHNIKQIEYSTYCKYISISSSISGYLLLMEDKLNFVALPNESDQETEIDCELERIEILDMDVGNVSHVLKQWHLLRDIALHISLTTGETHLFAFQTVKDRNDFYFHLMKKNDLQHIQKMDLQFLVKNWLSGKMTNFEYTMKLNNLAGRCFNDLSQYPLFPFIFSKYKLEKIDLKDANIYRNLKKNIFVQTAEQVKNKTEFFYQLQEEIKSRANVVHKSAYHCHNFLTNVVVVLYYNIRLPPFTQLSIDFQGGQFDCADRVFNSIGDTYAILTNGTNNDAKELTPEFFCLPEFLENLEGFDLGENQRGLQINDVSLPPWSDGDPRIFILVHRQALESDYVTKMLPYWIDLVFGFKQKGKTAMESLNIYHENAYFGTDVSENNIEARALVSHIKNCGQVPKQLFNKPHPTVEHLKIKSSSNNHPPLPTVSGLRWGDYVGSPDCKNPFLVWTTHRNHKICHFTFVQENKLFALTPNKTIIKEKDSLWTGVNWNRPDKRIKLKNSSNVARYLSWTHSQISCSESLFHDGMIFFGMDSGIISVYRCNKFKTLSCEDEGPINLYGHKTSVTDIKVCQPFKLFYSSSTDGTVNYWDLNNMNLVTSIHDHKGPVKKLGTSLTLGDLASVSYLGSNCTLMLHSVNGKKISEQSIKGDKIRCLVFSSRPEGKSINVLLAGMKSGFIRLYCSWNLMLIKVIMPFGSITAIRPSILSLAYCLDDQHLVGSTKDNLLFFLSHKKDVDLKEIELIYV